MKILFLDIETTGQTPDKHGIIQIAAALHEDRKVLSTFSSSGYVGNGNINLTALKLNKSKLRNVLDNKTHHKSDFLYDFLHWLLENNVDSNTHIGGHRVNFDTEFINSVCEKHEISKFTDLTSGRLLDTSGLYLALVQSGKLMGPTSFKSGTGLAAIAKQLGIEVNENRLHDSVYDVELTAKVYYKLIDTINAIPVSLISPNPINITVTSSDTTYVVPKT